MHEEIVNTWKGWKYEKMKKGKKMWKNNDIIS